MDILEAKTIVSSLMEGKGELLYLSEFGSRLYGTHTENSDYDAKGIFLPSVESCVLGTAPRHLNFTTGNDTSRNTKDDVDIELWSLQYFLSLLKKGETGAIDLLFSLFSENNKKWVSDAFLSCMRSYAPCDLFNLRDTTSFISYAYGQAKKYGIKGSSLGRIEELLEWLKEKNLPETERVGVLFEELIQKFGEEKHCFLKEQNGAPMLFFLGKGYDARITISETMQRLQTTYDKYGERARLAKENKGVDWKALSHALRAAFQMKSLIETRMISFPLKEAELLKKIKSGDFGWKETESMIVSAISEVEDKIQEVPPNNKVERIHREIIASLYGFGEKNV